MQQTSGNGAAGNSGAALTDREIQQKARARKRLIRLSIFAVAMLAFAYANVPLFRVFCTHLGLYTPPNEKLAAQATPVDHSKQLQLLFSGVTATGLEVQFGPDHSLQEAYIGERMKNSFHFYNPTDKVVKFRAIHDIYPPQAATHFALMQCFCFSDQVLQPHQSRTLPVVYQLNPGIGKDVERVSLNYTLYPEH